ncbi:MAG: hypothetical protein IJV27_02340 [Prevotella sp.]|nr:hypothetical protein [Prevotella sp.]
MNERRVAVFVEGLTELVFVRELLQCWYQYDSNEVGFECFNLCADNLLYSPYKLGSATESRAYFQIINVGNDNSVKSAMCARREGLSKAGYTIIGLRDLYSTLYIKAAGRREIVPDVSRRLMEAEREGLEALDGVQLFYAVMEVEAWLLGMHSFLLKLDAKLTPEYIAENVGINLEDDVETTIFHPAKKLGEIYKQAGKEYGKHLTDISSISSKLAKEDYIRLAASGHCASFKAFLEAIVGEAVA